MVLVARGEVGSGTYEKSEVGEEKSQSKWKRRVKVTKTRE